MLSGEILVTMVMVVVVTSQTLAPMGKAAEGFTDTFCSNLPTGPVQQGLSLLVFR